MTPGFLLRSKIRYLVPSDQSEKICSRLLLLLMVFMSAYGFISSRERPIDFWQKLIVYPIAVEVVVVFRVLRVLIVGLLNSDSNPI